MKLEKRKDIIILVADKNMDSTISTVLTRLDSFGIRKVTSDIFIHPYRDAGVLNESHEFLRPFQNKYSYAMVLFDKEGCGDFRTRELIERSVEENISNSGWRNRCTVIVFDPELEIWAWSDSPHVATALGWKQKDLNLWLQQKSFCLSKNQKPNRPKEAMEGALRERQIPRSSAIYREIALKVSLTNCSDACFLKFREMLRKWFPALGMIT